MLVPDYRIPSWFYPPPQNFRRNPALSAGTPTPAICGETNTGVVGVWITRS